jgi:hypothetical protein
MSSQRQCFVLDDLLTLPDGVIVSQHKKKKNIIENIHLLFASAVLRRMCARGSLVVVVVLAARRSFDSITGKASNAHFNEHQPRAAV